MRPKVAPWSECGRFSEVSRRETEFVFFLVRAALIVEFVTPNVRAEAGPTAKRQARAVENAPARRAGLAF